MYKLYVLSAYNMWLVVSLDLIDGFFFPTSTDNMYITLTRKLPCVMNCRCFFAFVRKDRNVAKNYANSVFFAAKLDIKLLTWNNKEVILLFE